jgi:NADPH:quinone reductase-like Zn-dependent oxidoreductase
MQAIIYEEYGHADKLQYKTYPIPVPQDNEVLIKVHAAGINPVDWKIREGYLRQAMPHKLPIIPGWDVSGTISAVGANCTRFKVGDEVYSYARPAPEVQDDSKDEQVTDNGCCAEYVAVKEWKVSSKPKTLSFEAAAGVPLAALTAWQGIFDKGGLKSGQTLLVLGAAGGVGSFAVQFAKEKGAIVIGTCSTKNVDTVKGLGADFVIDYSKGNVVEQVHAVSPVIDVVFDCVGGSSTKDGVAAVKNDGVVVSIAEWGVGKLCQDAGKGTGIAFMVCPSHTQLDEIRELIDAGKVKLAGLETLPLAECAKAHEVSQSGRTVGKLVLTVS